MPGAGRNAPDPSRLCGQLDLAESGRREAWGGRRKAAIYSIAGVIACAVKKQGPVQKALTAKRGPIAKFIAERLQFQYIEAVRDEAKSQRIVENMVSRALATLESHAEYQKALKAIEDAERPVLQQVNPAAGKRLDSVIGTLSSPNEKLDRRSHSNSSTTVAGTNSVEPSATLRPMRRFAAANRPVSSRTR